MSDLIHSLIADKKRVKFVAVLKVWSIVYPGSYNSNIHHSDPWILTPLIFLALQHQISNVNKVKLVSKYFKTSDFRCGNMTPLVLKYLLTILTLFTSEI